MKKYIISLIALSATSFSFADVLPASITGGGSGFLDITETPAVNAKVNATGTTGTAYAGIQGVALSYLFNTSESASESVIAYEGTSNFEIKNNIIATFDKAAYPATNSLIFNVNNSSHLIVNTLELKPTNDSVDNYISFRNTDASVGSKVTYVGTDGSGPDDAEKKFNNLRGMIYLSNIEFTNQNRLTAKSFKITAGSKLSLGADIDIEIIYMNSGYAIDLNGHSLKSVNGLNVEGTKDVKVISVSFGTEAGDTANFAIKGNQVTKNQDYIDRYNLVQYQFTDYDPLTDFIYMKDIPTGENSLSVIGGDYAGKVFESKAVTEGEYAGWTQYYITPIPEPSTVAAVIGALAIAFALRRKITR